MTTEIQRIPGAFNLPADWPRIRLGSITKDLWAHYVGDDGTPTDPAALSTGTPLVLPLASRTGTAPLTLAGTGGTPNVRQISTYAKGHRYFSHTGQLIYSADFPAYNGPFTAAFVAQWSGTGNTARKHVIMQTGNSATGAFKVYVRESDDRLCFVSADSTGEKTPLTIPFAKSVPMVGIACFDGANSWLRLGDTTVTGNIGSVGNIVRFSQGGYSGFPDNLNGRVLEQRVYRRAITADESDMLAEHLTGLYI